MSLIICSTTLHPEPPTSLQPTQPHPTHPISSHPRPLHPIQSYLTYFICLLPSHPTSLTPTHSSHCTPTPPQPISLSSQPFPPHPITHQSHHTLPILLCPHPILICLISSHPSPLPISTHSFLRSWHRGTYHQLPGDSHRELK